MRKDSAMLAFVSKGTPSLTLAAVAMATMLVACKPQGDHPPGAPGGMAKMPPPEVAVVTVQPQTVPVVLEYTGQIAGVRDIEVRARVTGILTKRSYVEGATVKAGQSMFTIDQAPFQAVLARADADLAGAEARQAQAQRDAARFKPLYEAHAIAQKDYDDAVSAEQVAAADVKSVRARLTEARLNLTYTRVEAPISGIAGRALKTEGSLVSGPDVLLTTVTQMDPIYAIFGVSDNEQLKLNRDAEAGRLILPRNGKFDATVKFADGSEYAQPGKINFSDIRINPATGTSEARAELPNSSGTLRPGQFVRVALQGAQRVNAILVPQRAVLEGPQGKFVFVANAESKVEIHPVEVGEWTGGAWVVNTGLKAGDRVIVDGVIKIGPGVTVKVAAADAPNASATPDTTSKR